MEKTNNETNVVKNTILVKDLKKNFYVFGNKGDLWSNTPHIAHSGTSLTMCGRHMLSSNHCQGQEAIGCQECIIEYEKEIKLDNNVDLYTGNMGEENSAPR